LTRCAITTRDCSCCAREAIWKRRKHLEAATKEDPQFAVAYSRLGEAYSALGYDADAEQASRHAVDLSQNLPLSSKIFHRSQSGAHYQR
jgi:predicted Zn-dependent protease